MSFRCEECGEPQLSGTVPHKVVTKVREVDYPFHSGIGWEVAEQKNFCSSCVGKVEDAGAAARAKSTAYVSQPPTTVKNLKNL